MKENEPVYYPTFSTKSLMSTLLIDATEQRDVDTFYVPGAYLKTEMPAEKCILLHIRYEFADIMFEDNPE